MAHLEIWCGYASFREGAALVLDATATTRALLFITLSEVRPTSPLSNTPQNRSEYTTA